jgi:glycogen debranching enzyme
MAKKQNANQTPVAPATAADGTTEMATTTTNENRDIVSQFSQDFSIDKDKIAALTDAEVVKRYLDAKQIGTAARKRRIAFFEDMQRRFKNYKKKRNGIPTLECAFEDYGMDYNNERQAVYRERQRIKEDANPQSTKTRDEAKLPQSADGAEVIVKANGHPVTVVHDNVTTDNVLVDEETLGEPPVRKKYKRKDLCSQAEYGAAQAKKTRKQQSLADEAAANAYYADRYFDLLGFLLNVPKDATAEEIIAKMKAEAEVAYQSLDAERAKRIKQVKWSYDWEFCKAVKPCGVKNVYHDDLGVLCECKNKSEAEGKIAAYDSEASTAA